INVVFSGLERDSTAFAYISFFSPRPDSGPKQEAPCVLSSKNPVHAVGNCNNLSVCPVGAVSKITCSYLFITSYSYNRWEYSSNYSISNLIVTIKCISIFENTEYRNIPPYRHVTSD